VIRGKLKQLGSYLVTYHLSLITSFMAEPEISHRCMACGAAIRSRAQFCPQCGKPLKKASSDALPAAKASEAQPSGRIDRELKTTPLAPTPTMIEPQPQDASSSAESQTAIEAAPEPRAVKDEKHAKKHRVKQATRGVVQENVRPRVEKLRKASNVVIEEVAIDPSLRFILIAVLIFIIFITLLLLSFIK
jgi:hypothetical protein